MRPKRGGRPGTSAAKRVAEDVRMKLAQLMLRELRDPRLAGIHLTRVEMTADLSLARAFYRATPGGADIEEAGPVLRGAAGFLRRELGKSLRLRATPEIRFAVDTTVDEGDRVEALLGALQEPRNPAGDDDSEE